MPSEPEWLASISSGTVCTWFYILAIFNSIFAVAGVLGAIMLLSNGKLTMVGSIPLMFGIIVGFINAWALFVVCKRGINNEGFRRY